MARPIKIHEDTLLKVMQKSLKPLEVSMSKVSVALKEQSVENSIEGKRKDKITQDNDIKQTSLLKDIASSFKYERALMEAGWKGMKKMGSMSMKMGKMGADLGKGIFGVLKNNWGKLLLGGVGAGAYGLANMDSHKMLTMVSELNDSVYQTNETIALWNENLHDPEWREQVKNELKADAEEVGKNVAIAFAGYMATKGALKIAEVLGPLLVTYFINKRLITNAVNAAIGGGAAAAGGAAAGGAAAGAAGKTTWDIIKQKSRINAKKMMKGLKAAAKVARLLPVLGIGGTVLGYAAAAATVYAAGDAIKQGFFGDDMAGKDFGEKIKTSLAKFLEDMSAGLIKKDDTEKRIDEATDKMGDSLIENIKSLNWKLNSNLTKANTWAEGQTFELDKWWTEKKKEMTDWMKKPGLGSTGVAGPSEASKGIGLTREEQIEQHTNKGKTPVKQSNPEAEAQAARQRERAKQGADGNEPGWWDKTKSFWKEFSKPSMGPKWESDLGGPQKYSSILEDKKENPNMGKVSWNLLGGKGAVHSKILKAWNSFGGLPQPYFTSGYRDENHPLSKQNENSTHITGTAIDMKSKHLPGHMKSAVYTALHDELVKKGDFTWGHDHLAGFGDHFHFQRRVAPIATAMKKGGLVKGGRGGGVFIVGESGQDELVMPLPGNSPHQRMTMMNSLYNERAMSTSNGSSPVTVVNNTSNNSSSSPTAAIIPQQVRSKSYVG